MVETDDVVLEYVQKKLKKEKKHRFALFILGGGEKMNSKHHFVMRT